MLVLVILLVSILIFKKNTVFKACINFYVLKYT